MLLISFLGLGVSRSRRAAAWSSGGGGAQGRVSVAPAGCEFTPCCRRRRDAGCRPGEYARLAAGPGSAIVPGLSVILSCTRTCSQRGAALQSRLSCPRTGASTTGAPTLTTTVLVPPSAAPAPSVAPLGVPEVRTLPPPADGHPGFFMRGFFASTARVEISLPSGRDLPPLASLSSLSTRLFDNYDDQRQRSHRPETRALAGDGARDALLALAALRGLQGGRDA